MKVLVCGGRDFTDWDYLKDQLGLWLDALPFSTEPIELIHGGCKGADVLAQKWADDSDEDGRIPTQVFLADWKKHGRAAGPIRNRQMLSEGKPDLVLAFAGGKGTDNMCAQAIDWGIEVRRFWPGKTV